MVSMNNVEYYSFWRTARGGQCNSLVGLGSDRIHVQQLSRNGTFESMRDVPEQVDMRIHLLKPVHKRAVDHRHISVVEQHCD